MLQSKLAVITMLFFCLNSIAQKTEFEMKEFYQNNGDFINYEILPERIKVQFSIIKSRQQFESVLSKLNGKRIELTKNVDSLGTDFIKAFPLYDFSNSARVFMLSNGTLAVDQSAIDKGNPFYLCGSIRDHKLISQYLSIFYIPELKEPIVNCGIYDDMYIREFLNKEKFKLDSEKSTNSHRLFTSENGQYIYVSYGMNKLTNEEIYYSLVIYESFEKMKLLGVLNEEMDQHNFKSYPKKLLSYNHTCFNIIVINAKEMISENSSLIAKVFEDGFKRDYFESLLTGQKTIYVQYTPDIYFQFSSKHDFDEYVRGFEMGLKWKIDLDFLKKKAIDEIDSMDSSSYIADRLLLFNNKNSLEKSLKLLDIKINEFFFDEYFINFYFPKIVAYVGSILIDKLGGQWVIDRNHLNLKIVLKNNSSVDFAQYLFDAMNQQKYNGVCSTEAIIGAILDLSKFSNR